MKHSRRVPCSARTTYSIRCTMQGTIQPPPRPPEIQCLNDPLFGSTALSPKTHDPFVVPTGKTYKWRIDSWNGTLNSQGEPLGCGKRKVGDDWSFSTFSPG
jgi:hypothetical protein